MRVGSSRGRLVTCLAVVATLAVAAPAMAVSKAEKRQNAGIKSGISQAKKARRDAAKAGKLARKLGKDLGAAKGDVAKLKTLAAGLPPVLTQLGDGLKKVGDGLQSLKTLGTSTEYGFLQIGQGTANTPVPGCFYESSDIPDSVQDAMLTGTCLLPSSIAAGTALHFNVGIRSFETDGTGATNPAGVAGIVAYDQQNTAPCTALPCLTLVGAGATTPTAGGQPPAVPIPLKSAPTSTTETSFPFSTISTDKTVDLATTQFTGQPAAPVVAAAGNIVHFTIRFNDLTADPNDPAA